MTTIQGEEKVKVKIKKVKINQVHLVVRMKEECLLKDMKEEKAVPCTKEIWIQQTKDLMEEVLKLIIKAPCMKDILLTVNAKD